MSVAKEESIESLRAEGLRAGWLVRRDRVELAQGPPLGKGASGVVRRATVAGDPDCVAKEVDVSSPARLAQFAREVRALARARSARLVPFLGAVVGDEGCSVLYAYMPGGELGAWLHKGDGRNASASARLRVALDVALALRSLEESEPPLMYRDVKPSNVLLDAAGRARLADFGLARDVPVDRAELTGETGSYRYMAPEVFRHEPYDAKADVYSFGVLLNELLTGEEPYDERYLTPVQIAQGVAAGRLRPRPPKECHPGVLALIEVALSATPSERPSFAEVTTSLGRMLPALEAAEAPVEARPSTPFERFANFFT